MGSSSRKTSKRASNTAASAAGQGLTARQGRHRRVEQSRLQAHRVGDLTEAAVEIGRAEREIAVEGNGVGILPRP